MRVHLLRALTGNLEPLRCHVAFGSWAEIRFNMAGRVHGEGWMGVGACSKPPLASDPGLLHRTAL